MLAAARSLATRWNDNVEAVRSGTYDGRWGLIIDSAMNMQLLFHAARLTPDPGEAGHFRRIAHQHLRTLERDFVRADGSTFHRLTYDATTGGLLGAVPGQGYRETSTWSRGQAWAIYGFTAGYRQTRDDRLLAAARRTAGFWLANASDDCVPPWDFAAPAHLPQKDSSAGAIAAAGLLDLAVLDPDPALRATYRAHGLRLLAQLTSPAYTTEGTNHPAVLRRQSYSIPAAAREGSYIWGDHYLLEAMSHALRLIRVTPRLLITAPARTSYDVPVRVVGRASLPGGAPAAGVPVRLEEQAGQRGVWTPVATGVTGRSGAVSLRILPRASVRLRIVSPGVSASTRDVGGYRPARSGSLTMQVAVTGKLRVAARRGTSVVFAVPRVAMPNDARLVLQQRRGRTWQTLRVLTRTPATSTRFRRQRPRYFRVLPLVSGPVAAVPSPTVKVRAR